MSNKPNTVSLHRVFTAPPEKLYRAFIEREAMAKWLPPKGFTGKVDYTDAKEGGSYRMSFTNFGTGSSHWFGGTYIELKPNSKIKYIDKFEDPAMPGEMTVTVILKEVLCGTDVEITQENLPDAIPVEFCYLGWQESLDQLAALVEPNIPDNQ